MSTRDLLIEIGTEELPPKASVKLLIDEFVNGVVAGLKEAGVFNAGSENVTGYATPRRLAMIIKNVATQQADREVEKRGPAIQAAFDKDGKFTKAAEGFARSCNVSVGQLGRIEVRRSLLDALRDEAPPVATHRGALDGARLSNLLPGVWSARMPIKLAARRCETLLEGWLEPWTAVALAYGGADERPALEAVWRSLLHCQAHDSTGGCATDAVAAQVEARLADTVDLAAQTLDRVLAGLAGLGPSRGVPLRVNQTIAVFNPSPHPRADTVRLALGDYPALRLPLGEPALGPLTLAVLEGSGFTVDGAPARLVPSDDPSRARWVPGTTPLDLEFVARDVPALGFRRFRLEARAADARRGGRRPRDRVRRPHRFLCCLLREDQP